MKMEAPDILEVLAHHHDRLRELAGRLDGRPDPDELEELFDSLREAITTHTTSEEHHFHQPLLAWDPVRETVRYGIAEHQELDGIVERLERLDHGDATWLAKARYLRNRLLRHLDEEERVLFPLVREHVPSERLREMAQDYLRGSDAG